MRLRAGSAAWRYIVATGVAAIVASLAIGLGFRDTNAPAPQPMTLDAALAALGGATDFYLHIPSIQGESTAQGHVNDIDVEALTWGLTNSAGTAGGAAFNVTLTKGIDRASPLLMQAGAAGTSIDTVVLTGVKPAGMPFTYFTLSMAHTKVKSFKQTADRTNGFSAENVGLAFTRVNLKYTIQGNDGNAAGNVNGCWDLSTKKIC